MGFYLYYGGSFEFILVKCGCDVNIFFHFFISFYLLQNKKSYQPKRIYRKGNFNKSYDILTSCLASLNFHSLILMSGIFLLLCKITSTKMMTIKLTISCMFEHFIGQFKMVGTTHINL